MLIQLLVFPVWLQVRTYCTVVTDNNETFFELIDTLFCIDLNRAQTSAELRQRQREQQLLAEARRSQDKASHFLKHTMKK